MNLHAVAGPVVAAVNPTVPLSVLVSTGYTQDSAGKQVPQYAPETVSVPGQLQSLTFNDLQHLDGLNIQGIKRAIYLYGRIDGLVRVDSKGGDLIMTPDGNTWKVVLVLEYWPDWCKVAVTLQNGS